MRKLDERLWWVVMVLGVSWFTGGMLSGCGDEASTGGASQVLCPDGEIVAYQGRDFCALTSIGAPCPESFPNRRAFNEALICATLEEIPDGLEGFLQEANATPCAVDEDCPQRASVPHCEGGDLVSFPPVYTHCNADNRCETTHTAAAPFFIDCAESGEVCEEGGCVDAP